MEMNTSLSQQTVHVVASYFQRNILNSFIIHEKRACKVFFEVCLDMNEAFKVLFFHPSLFSDAGAKSYRTGVFMYLSFFNVPHSDKS